jgi:hypothetical protein
MTMLEVVAALAGAALGWSAGALKAQLHSLRRPQRSPGSGGDSIVTSARAPQDRSTGAVEPRGATLGRTVARSTIANWPPSGSALTLPRARTS